LPDLCLTLGRAEIAGDRGFATVGGVEISRRPFAVMVDEGRAPAAGVIPLGRLDLDDLGTQI